MVLIFFAANFKVLWIILLNKILIPPNKSDKVSFSANDTAKPPTPRAVINGVIEMPNDCRINKIPIEKIATFVKPLKIPVDGSDLFVWDQMSNNPKTTFDTVILIEIIKKADMIFWKISSGPGRSEFPTAIDEEARKNQNTITESIALITTSSLCQLFFSDNDFNLETRNLLKNSPKRIPNDIVTSGSIQSIKFAGM